MQPLYSEILFLSLDYLFSRREILFLSLDYRQAYNTKMMGQRGKLAFRFQVRGSVFLQSTKINDGSSALPCSKRAFSDVIEGVALKIFLWADPKTHIFLPFLFGSSS